MRFSSVSLPAWCRKSPQVSKALPLLYCTACPPATSPRIESTFATLRLRKRVTKGPRSRAAGVAMAVKLIESAQARWRAVNAPHLVALVRAGAMFENGELVERPDV
jgi:hypothetical protein